MTDRPKERVARERVEEAVSGYFDALEADGCAEWVEDRAEAEIFLTDRIIEALRGGGEEAVAYIDVEDGTMVGVEKVGPEPPDGRYALVPGRPTTETEAPGEGETGEKNHRWVGGGDQGNHENCCADCGVDRKSDAALDPCRPDPDEGSGEGEGMRWTDEDEAELRDYQSRVSCAGRYDQYEPTRHDHSRLAELKERKKRKTKAWFRQVEEYQNLSDSALEQVARYRAEQGGVNPDTAALLVLLCERWSRLRSRPEPTLEGGADVRRA